MPGKKNNIKVKVDGVKILNLIHDKGKTVKTVSNDMGYCDSYLAKYTSGISSEMLKRSAESLARVLGVTLDDVLYHEPEPVQTEVVTSGFVNHYAEPTEAQQIITWLKVIHRDLQELGKLQLDLWK